MKIYTEPKIAKPKSKILGQVFTPEWIVDEILFRVGYSGKNILNKKIIDPSCGDGAFLKKIISVYIDVSIKNKISKKNILKDLSLYIYGIEIDKFQVNICIENLNKIILEKLKTDRFPEWKIICSDTLLIYKDFKNIFDYVIGNPPYVRIHNLDDSTRLILKNELNFCKGTTDLYLAFFEIGFSLLNGSGKLGYISPNSFLHNVSYREFRSFLSMKKSLKILIDFKSSKVFESFSTYTAISIFDNKNKIESIEYYELIDDKIKQINNVKYISLKKENWIFSDEKNDNFLHKQNNSDSGTVKNFFNVQYGLATLRDKIFISATVSLSEEFCIFNGFEIEKSILRKIVKGSTYKGLQSEVKNIIFPYKIVGSRYVAMKESEIKENYPMAYSYLLKNKEELVLRDMDKGSFWYEFGRSQGLQTSDSEKIVLSTLVKDEINFYKLDPDTFVYSGIFITQKNKDYKWSTVENILKSEDFLGFIKVAGKDFSGGYKSLSTKNIKDYKIII